MVIVGVLLIVVADLTTLLIQKTSKPEIAQSVQEAYAEVLDINRLMSDIARNKLLNSDDHNVSDQVYKNYALPTGTKLTAAYPQGYFVKKGLISGDKVVSQGAQLLLSKEQKDSAAALGNKTSGEDDE